MQHLKVKSSIIKVSLFLISIIIFVMINSFVIIHDLNDLYDILKEIEDSTKFKILNYSKNRSEIDKLKEDPIKRHVLITAKNENKIKGLNNLIIDKWPLKIDYLIDQINISLIKKNYFDQSEISIKNYLLDCNSRELSKNLEKLKLTQKETEIITFLYNSKLSIPILTLQKEVWGHNSELETHTVETHIYRLRKKILKKFNDEKFIISTNNGYKI
tara:strand:- start:4488 stop:5132 length:645 start_codon:yes stop_codon:yes gene_type:complete